MVNEFIVIPMDIKTKLKSIIIFSYIALGLLVVLPVVLPLFEGMGGIFIYNYAQSLSAFILGSILVTFRVILLGMVMAISAPFSMILNFSGFIQNISIRTVIFLITGLLNWIALILASYCLIHFKNEFKDNKTVSKLKIHFKIILGIIPCLIALFVLFSVLIAPLVD